MTAIAPMTISEPLGICKYKNIPVPQSATHLLHPTHLPTYLRQYEYFIFMPDP
jgi:hypothetical protein